MLAHKDEYFHQNPPNLGENLFAWQVPPSSSMTSLIKKKKPAVTGKDVAVYWYKTRKNYDYYKDAKVLHAHAGNIP